MIREDGEEGDKIHEGLVTEINKLHKRIIQETGENNGGFGT